ncbi:AraC family transcriptional regulator [Pectinatus haikarae]|uniref:AraC family transcriptional regulator n=1 Tax=Pectinatus haikarae TaxID=349096 RepID=UPI0018C7E59E|nr:AraC family transcriptional regulator [Pectinatus haikarae]
MHQHDDRLEILFIKQGKNIYIINGQKYYASQGNVVIINSGVPHEEIAADNDGAVVYSCAVTNLHVDGLKANCLISDIQFPIIKDLSEYQKQEIENMFLMMYGHINKNSIYSGEIAIHILKALMMNLLELLCRQKNTDVEQFAKCKYSNNICHYIISHFGEQISLEKIARIMNLNQYYIAHIFKKNVGSSIIEYLVRCRLGEAQSYLLQTNKTITDIAYIVGFNSGSYFQTIFKKYIGVTPKGYRKCWTDSINGDFINILM